jgi:pimeloyl-ACP methyl ester carboxylesterase
MPTLVLLPGLDGTGRLFEPFLRELPAGWQTVVVRYPADVSLGYDELTRLAEAALPSSGALILLGESFSGPIAIRLAASLGSRLQALVLCCSFARSPRRLLTQFTGIVGLLPPPARLPSALSTWALLGARAPVATRELLMRVLAGLPVDVIRARLKMVAGVDVEHRLAGLQAPVLYLQAQADRLVPASVAAGLRQTVPTVRVVQLQGGHGLLQSAPAAAAAAIKSFVEQLPTRT